MSTLPSVPLAAGVWVRIDTPAPWASGNSYRLQAKTNTPASLFIGASPDDTDSLLVSSLEMVVVPYDGTAVWMRATQFDGEVAIEDIGQTISSGGGGSGGASITGYALEATQQQVLAKLEQIRQLLLPVTFSVQIAMPALSPGQSYTDSIAVPGVVAGNAYALAMVGLSNPEIPVTMNVATNDAVNIGITNLSGGDVPALALLLTIKQL